MKRLLTTLKEKWPEYILEILVLIIGIYGAFALDSWNEERKKQNLEFKYLRELRNDLTETKQEINRDIIFLNEALHSSQIIKNVLFSHIPYHDSLETHFRRIGRDAQLYPKNSAMQSISSTGLDILSNDSLRIGITSFYNITLQDIIDLGRHNQAELNIINTIKPFQLRHFRIGYDTNQNGSRTSKWLIKDEKALYEDDEFLFVLELVIAKRLTILERLYNARIKAEVLTSMINNQIDH